MDQHGLLIDKTLQKIQFIYRYGGFNVRSGDQKQTKLFWMRCLYINNLFWLGMDLAGGIYWFIDGVQNGKDFLGLTYIAPCIFLSTLGTLKGIFLTASENNVHKLIDSMRKFEKTEKKRKRLKAKEDIAAKESRFLNLLLTSLTILYVMLISTFTFSPLVLMAVKYYNTKEFETILPFLILYPFDSYQIRVWPFVYLHQFWSECVVCLDVCAADYLFFSCCTYLRIQFRCLQHDLENIIPYQDNSNRRVIQDEAFKEKFKDLIQWHQELIESANMMETIYTKSTLFNFMSSSLMICLTGFNVTMVDDAVFVITFLCFLLMSLVQVFFLCFFADLLTTSSTEVSHAVYRSNWYMTEPKIAKSLLLVQTRSQKPCVLTAFGFAEVNLNSFMRVLSTSWSYFALLQTMYGN